MQKQHSKDTGHILSAAFLAAAMLFTQVADAPDALYQSDITPFCEDIPEYLIAHHEEKHGPIDRDGACPFVDITHRTGKTYSIF